MVALLAKAELGDGRVFYYEEDVPAGGEFPASLADQRERFGEALTTIRDAAGELFETLASLPRRPDECELSFGVKLSTEAGALIAKVGAEANFTVKLSWKSLG